MADKTNAAATKPLELSPQTPKIAAPFWSPISPADLASWQRRGLDIAELRLDKATSQKVGHLRTVARSFANIPTILTIRAGFEGGAYRSNETTRAKKIVRLLPLVSAVDLELAAEDLRTQVADAVDDWREQNPKRLLILSRHDFRASFTTDELDNTLAAALDAGADVVKLACICRSFAGFRKLTAWTGRAAAEDRRVIVIGMADAATVRRATEKMGSFKKLYHMLFGDRNQIRKDEAARKYALTARCTLPHVGSCVAFAIGEGATAAGQLSVEEMAAALRAGAA